METLKSFIQEVKSGQKRGELVQEQVSDNVIVELSVSTFEDGYIHLRVLVEDERIPQEDNLFFRRLYKYDTKYQSIHTQVSDCIEEENETELSNAHEWEMNIIPPDHPSIPSDFSAENTVAFEDIIRLRDDVSIIEAIETNRID